MAFGVEILDGRGQTFNGSSTAGGVCLGLFTQATGTSQTYTFPRIPFGSLHYVLMSRGGHSFSITSGASGEAVLTLTSVLSGASSYLLFATAVNPQPGDYGMQYVNDAGVTITDTQYTVPAFLEAVVLGSTPTGSSGYNFELGEPASFIFSGACVASSAQERLVLWALPDNGGTIKGATQYLMPGQTTVSVAVSNGGSSFVLPVAIILGVRGGAGASNLFGIQAFDASGALIFDSTGAPIRLAAVSTTISFTDTPTATPLPGGLAIPAVLVGNYTRQWWVPNANNMSSKGYEKTGRTWRSGSNLMTGTSTRSIGWEDAYISSSQTWGSINSKLVMVDAAPLGVTFAAPVNPNGPVFVGPAPGVQSVLTNTVISINYGPLFTSGSALTFSFVSPTPPAGLTIDPATGVVGGTLATVGGYDVAIRATNVNGYSCDSPTLSFSVSAPAAGPVNPLNGGTSYNNYEEGGASMTFFSDGTVFDGSGFPQASWHSAPAPGVGNSYWIKATKISGTGTPSNLGVWRSLSANCGWSVTATSTVGRTASLNIEISNSATGSPVLATGTVTLSAYPISGGV